VPRYERYIKPERCLEAAEMSTPVKSPAQKKLKPDDGAAGEDDMDTENPAGAADEKTAGSKDVLVTLDAIAKLLDVKSDQQMKPLSESIDKLTADLGIFKTKMNDELAAMGLKFKEVQAQNSKLEKELQAVKEGTNAEISKSLSELKLDSPGKPDTNLTVVLGNIPDATNIDQVAGWVTKRCGETGVPKPVEFFIKSGEFGEVAFAKCTSISHRDNLIASVRSAPTNTTPKPWAKLDQPIDIRTAEGVLFAFKRLLADWGYSKRCVWVDKDKCVLSVAGTEVMRTSVDNYVLKIQWCDVKWGSGAICI
jgi:hypothetical protein